MNYCPKCGNKLNENDKFCSNCGEKIEVEVRTSSSAGKDFFNSTYTPTPTQTVDKTKTLPLAKVAFILSLTSIGLIILFVVFAALSYCVNDESRIFDIFGVLSLLFGIILGMSSLGLAIPGFILTRKRNYPRPIAIAALVLAIIITAIFLIFYFWYEITYTV